MRKQWDSPFFQVTTLHVMPSALKDTSAALKKALNEPSVPDLSASADQEISKEVHDRLPTPAWSGFL
jgi:hypothetical protein